MTISSPLIVLSSSPGQKTYKTQCVKDEECNKTKFLECNLHSYFCDCPKSTIWSWEKQQCLTMEGRPCGLQNHKGLSCVSNSTCISGRCICDEGYLKNNFGVCDLGYDMPCEVSVPSEGETSQSSKSCSWRYMLECPKSLPPNNSQEYEDSVKKCKCQGEGIDYIWDDERMKCVSLVGTGCDSTDNDWSDDKLECIKGGQCVRERCECLPGHSETPLRTCLLNYNENCDNTKGQFCNTFNFLNCQDGKCGCEFYGQMAYDNKVQQCRMLAGEVCDIPIFTNHNNNNEESDLININNNIITGDERIHQCIQDAECTQSPNHHKGKCVCKSGKQKTHEGTCTDTKEHGHPCNFTGDCNTNAFLTCVIDEHNGGLCDCMPNEMFYCNLVNECLVLPGRSCSKNKNCGRNSNCENAEYCTCNEGYSLDNTNFNCYLSNQEETSESQNEVVPSILITTTNAPNEEEDCSKIAKSFLDFQKCNCNLNPNSNIWSQEKEKCLSLVGSDCDFNESCVDLSYCDIDDKICQCVLSAKTTSNKTCVPKKFTTRHQPVQYQHGHNHNLNHLDSNSIHDGTEFSRLNPRVMKASSSSDGFGILASSFVFYSSVLFLIRMLIL